VQESEGVPLATIREAHLLKELDHPNILHLETVYINTSTEDLTLSLVFEFVDHDLHEMMQVGTVCSFSGMH
jgi:serine/threonine protein kinase